MKETKRRFEFFQFYDKTGIARHLEKMASEGWLLEKMSAFTWTYEKIEPKKMQFAVSYYATITDFEPEPTEEQQTFNEFCEHAGWKLAASTVQMQIFYNENENPVPIETDPALEIANLHRKVKKTVFPSYVLLLLCSFMLGASFIGTWLGDPVYLLSSALKMFTGAWSIITLVYTLTEILSYCIWRKKALKMAQQGEFLETHGHRTLGYAVLIFMFVSLFFYVISLGNMGFRFYMTAFLLVFLSGFFVVNGVKNLLKKKKVRARTNMVLTSVASFLVAFILMGAVNFITFRGIQNGIFEDGYDGLPIKIGELLDIDDSNYLQSHSTEDSVFLGQDTSSQHPYDNGPGYSMAYTVTEIKIPFLYDFVVEQLYQYDEWRGYDTEYTYEEIDAEEWGANQARELHKDGKPDNRFLICYDKYVLEIAVDWEMTKEQKQTIHQNICK